MWEASDETGHFAFVKYLASERRFPPPGQDLTQWFDESHQPPLYYILAALATSWIDTDDGLEPEINPHAFTGKGTGGVNIAIHSDREAFPYRGTALAMHVARLVSVLISTAVVAVTYLIGRLLFPHDEAIVVGAMALNAFWPQFLFLGSVVTNDILVVLVSSLVIFFLLRIAYGRRGIADFLGLGVSLLAAMGTKMSAWGLIPLAAAALILIAIRRAPPRARWWVLLLTGLCFSGAWLWLRSSTLPLDQLEAMRYGDVMQSALSFIQHPAREAARLPWDVVPPALKYCSRTIWASFGWDNIGVEEWVYQVFMLLCLAGAIGLISFMARRSQTGTRLGVVIIICGVLSLLLPAILTVMVRGRPFLHGRIVSAAIPLLSLLMFLGLSQLVPRRYRRHLAAAMGGSLCALALIIPFRYIAPAYARPPILSNDDLQDIKHPLQTNFDDKIELLGYDIYPDEAKTREGVIVTLYWRALSEMEENYSVGVHLVGPDYEPYGGRDSYPARGNYATSLWNEGDIIQDTYWLRIPRDFPTPSTGRAEITLYLDSTGQRLPVLNEREEAEANSVLLPAFGVVAAEEPEYAIETAVSYRLGDTIALLGYNVQGTTGEMMELTLYWQSLADTAKDYTVFVHLLDEQGQLLGQDDAQPLRGRYPTSVWKRGSVIQDRHYLVVPHDMLPGHHAVRIALGLYSLETMQRLPAFDSMGTRLPDDRILIGQDLNVVKTYRLFTPLMRSE